MKLTTHLLPAFAIAPGLVSAKCQDLGGWPNPQTVWWNDDIDNARFHSERACRGHDGVAGALQGVYQPGEIKTACVDLSGTIYAIFSVQNLNNVEAFDLSDDDCVKRLHNEINGCQAGGVSDIEGWRFRADPNNGFCQ
ncbi:hypothetical protein FDECE_1400 [Fusarium decemcellulare]|nr:hypothetical protein FDECE_1400 [Fusarium decemcellulare]